MGLRMEKILPVSGKQTLEQTKNILERSKLVRKKSWLCRLGFHSYRQGNCFEHVIETPTKMSRRLFVLMICHRCFDHKEQTVAEAISLVDHRS